jgi:3-hydroxyacyl-CoA dehydrogenase
MVAAGLLGREAGGVRGAVAAAGLLGRKTGRGYYDYSSGKQESYWKL